MRLFADPVPDLRPPGGDLAARIPCGDRDALQITHAAGRRGASPATEARR